jgi:hypothetical protein
MMFKARHFVIATLALAMSASAAFAGGDNDHGKRFKIGWDEFVARCKDPDSFDNQREPRQINIVCTNTEREFVPDAPGSLALGATRHVVTAVLSDKFDVSGMERDYPIAQKPSSCLRYKEIEKTFSIQRGPVGCGEVLTIAGKGDINDYCASALESAGKTTPKLIDVRDTGSVMDTCGGQGGGKK